MCQIPIKIITWMDKTIKFLTVLSSTQSCSEWSLSWSTQLAPGLTLLLEQVDDPGLQREADSPLYQTCLHTQPLRSVLDGTVQASGLQAFLFTVSVDFALKALALPRILLEMQICWFHLRPTELICIFNKSMCS